MPGRLLHLMTVPGHDQPPDVDERQDSGHEWLRMQRVSRQASPDIAAIMSITVELGVAKAFIARAEPNRSYTHLLGVARR